MRATAAGLGRQPASSPAAIRSANSPTCSSSSTTARSAGDPVVAKVTAPTDSWSRRAVVTYRIPATKNGGGNHAATLNVVQTSPKGSPIAGDPLIWSDMRKAALVVSLVALLGTGCGRTVPPAGTGPAITAQPAGSADPCTAGMSTSPGPAKTLPRGCPPP